MDADSVDAIVTDPPYGLEFMGKEWDSFRAGFSTGGSERFKNSPPIPTYGSKPGEFQAWCEAWGREALRVTKPGGYLLAFGGTRTHHRLVCGLEDAGWIIRDELDWIYASGFPKGKANLKPAHEPIVLARKPGPLRPLAIDECRIGTTDDLNGGAYSEPSEAGSIRRWEGGAFQRKPGEYEQPAGRWPSNVLLSDPALFDEPNPEVVGSGATTTVPGTYQSKPLTEWQTSSYPGSPPGDIVEGYGDSGGYSRFFGLSVPSDDTPAGRNEYPMALIVPKADRADREPVLRGQLEASDHAKYAQRGKCVDCGRWMEAGETECVCGGAYEYQSNGTTRRENAHPTVKPTDLMRHLVRLVTPQGGTVLDCFLGSGSTALAAELEGFQWIGIEKEAEYVKIAEARLNGTQKGLGLDVPAPIQQRSAGIGWNGKARKRLGGSDLLNRSSSLELD
jgi:site-specific DNA-methyltransferase (adenine-specific)